MWGAGRIGAVNRLYLSARSGVRMNDVGETEFVPVDEERGISSGYMVWQNLYSR